MNKQGATRIVKMIKAAYPNFDNNANPADIIALWAWRFKDTPFEKVMDAVGKYIDGDHEFYPKVGQIKAIINREGAMTPLEGWREIQRAIKNSARDSEHEFEKLSPPVKAYVGSPATLKELATMPYETHYLDHYQERFLRAFSSMQADGTPDYAALNKPEEAKIDGRMEKLIKGIEHE